MNYIDHSSKMSEELKKKQYNADKIVEQVNIWQKSPYVKHLVCRACENKLSPKKEGSKVSLKCSKCNWSQPYVPKPVIEYRMEVSETLKRNASKFNHLILDGLEDSDTEQPKK